MGERRRGLADKYIQCGCDSDAGARWEESRGDAFWRLRSICISLSSINSFCRSCLSVVGILYVRSSLTSCSCCVCMLVSLVPVHSVQNGAPLNICIMIYAYGQQ